MGHVLQVTVDSVLNTINGEVGFYTGTLAGNYCTGKHCAFTYLKGKCPTYQKKPGKTKGRDAGMVNTGESSIIL